MNEDKLVLSKIQDKEKMCYNKNILTHTKFLNQHELSIGLESLKKCDFYENTGGYDDAERQIIIFKPDYINDVSDILKIISFKTRVKVSHRDVLGSIMGLSIKREMIGDILCFDDRVFVFVLCEISDFLLLNLTKIGRQKIEPILTDAQEIPQAVEDCVLIEDTVKSIRLDSVVSAGYKISRTKAVDEILKGNVYFNNIICTKNDQKIDINDKISIRGMGKIILFDISGVSKKERIFIKIKKYV